MHRSGIQVDEELKSAFKAATEDASVAWMQVQIQGEAFKLLQTGNTQGTAGCAEDWTAITSEEVLKSREPCYILMKEEGGGKWIVIAFIEDYAPVRAKMLHASSVSAMRSDLGGSNFAKPDYNASDRAEITLEKYLKLKNVSNMDVMSYEERDKLESELASAHMMGTNQTAVIAGIPIKIDDSAMEGFSAVKSGSKQSIELVLDLQTEFLGLGPTDGDLGAIAGALQGEPRYFLLNWSHNDREGNAAQKVVFIYYCPGGAPPRSKMFYSTCKAHILNALQQLEFEKPVNIEIDTPEELSEERIMNNAYPITEVKEMKAKPKLAGGARGGRRKKEFVA